MAGIGSRIAGCSVRGGTHIVRNSRRAVMAMPRSGGDWRRLRRFRHRHMHDAHRQELAEQEDEHDGTTVNESRHGAKPIRKPPRDASG